jgi:hypothetical protein
MGIFAKLIGKTSAPPPKRVDHAVLVNFDYIGSTDLTLLFALETKLEAAIDAAKVGEFDGNEVATDGSDGTLYMYGPDADRLFEIIKPVLEGCSFMRGARITLRYGSPGADQRQLVLGS